MYTSFPSTTLFGSICDIETINVTEAGDAATRAAGDRAAVRDCRGQRRFAILDQHAHAVAVDRAGIVDRAARRQPDAAADPDDLPLRPLPDARTIGGRVLPLFARTRRTYGAGFAVGCDPR